MSELWWAVIILAVVSYVAYQRMSDKISRLLGQLHLMQTQLDTQQDDLLRLRQQLNRQTSPDVPSDVSDISDRTADVANKEVINTELSDVPPRPEHDFRPLPSVLQTDEQTFSQFPELAPHADAVPSASDKATSQSQSVISQSTPKLSPKSTPTPTPTTQPTHQSSQPPQSAHSNSPSTLEPDEQSVSVVTSLLQAGKNWFFGGNMVVRVGIIVLLIGVLLLLRLLSQYFSVPIETKLLGIGITGLALAGLGLTLVKKRFGYGISLQGAGLSIAYMTTFFAYRIYDVLPSLPSFALLTGLSALTIGLAIRQNAFVLAVLALAGAFFAPMLASDDSGSLVMLFGYYLLLNLTIAIMAHLRPWKVLNVMGAGATFGLAYYWGGLAFDDIAQTERWQLVGLVLAHWALYVFIVVRYVQQLVAHNARLEADSPLQNDVQKYAQTETQTDTQLIPARYVFPMDAGLLFSVPLLAFGLLIGLLRTEARTNDYTHVPALTLICVGMAGVYLALCWGLGRWANARTGQTHNTHDPVANSTAYRPLIEGMLALGLGFVAMAILQGFGDSHASWVAVSWAVQGVAMVWFARRSLKAWLAVFGMVLQGLAMFWVLFDWDIGIDVSVPLLVTAKAWLGTAYILRASHRPFATLGNSDNPAVTLARLKQHRKSTTYQLIWENQPLATLLMLVGVSLTTWALVYAFDAHLVHGVFGGWGWFDALPLALVVSLTIYWLCDTLGDWREIRWVTHGVLPIFYAVMLWQWVAALDDVSWTLKETLLVVALLGGWAVLGQAWLKRWWAVNEQKTFDTSAWLLAGFVLLSVMAWLKLPDSDGLMAVAVPSVMLMGILFALYRMQHAGSHSGASLPVWFNWTRATAGASGILIPLFLLWVVLANAFHDGDIWGMTYLPILSVFDVTCLLAIASSLGGYWLRQSQKARHSGDINLSSPMAKVLGGVMFWWVSSMLVRTLHAYADTPLWFDGAWHSDQVQTGLTILWTLIALVLTVLASRLHKRFWWLAGIGLLGVVVFKLVLVDLSQTEAIWRVISFIGAGSVILLIGYVAPLPPEGEADKS